MINKLLKELKQNKFTVVVFCIFLGLFLLGWLVFGLVMPKSGEPVYGNRLEGIEEVKITEDQTSDLVKELKSKDYVVTASVHIKGRIVNVLVETKKGTKTSTAKTLNKIVLKEFMSGKWVSLFPLMIKNRWGIFSDIFGTFLLTITRLKIGKPAMIAALASCF